MSSNPYTRDTFGKAVGNHAERIQTLESTAPGTQYEIKVVADIDSVASGNGLFILAVPADLDANYLIAAEAFVTTAGTGVTTIQIRKVGVGDLLSTPITIDSGEFTSYTAATPSVPAYGFNEVSTGDLLAVDVSAAASGSRGLGVILKIG